MNEESTTSHRQRPNNNPLVSGPAKKPHHDFDHARRVQSRAMWTEACHTAGYPRRHEAGAA